MLTSKDSDAVQEVSFCETQDPDGDFTWLVSRPGPERRLEFVAGSGKYEGVSGSVRVTGGTERKDGVHMPSIETEWSFPEKRED